MKQVYVFGHKNPDTDSVCAAITLSYLKNQLGMNCVPKVIGPVNRGTKFALEYFKVNTPSYLNDVKVQMKDVKYTKKAYIKDDASIEESFVFMKNHELTALPLVDNKKHITGYVSLRDIAKYLADSKKRYLKTNLDHLLNTLNGKIIVNYQFEYDGNVNSVVFDNDINNSFINKKSIVIVGNRDNVIDYAIDSHAQLIILVGGKEISKSQLLNAQEKKVSVISTKLSGFEVCSKLYLSTYIRELSNASKVVCLDSHSFYSDFLNVHKRYKHTTYPIINKQGECLGSLKITDISNFEEKNVILVDHNNYEESIDGLREAKILEIIDHHNLGSIGTNTPISFISRPVGCTCTIIYYEFIRYNVSIPTHIAGLLLSAIISDTILFSSPTTTEEDIEVANKLAKIANVNINKYGKEMLKASTSIKGLSINDLINQDFKAYSINNRTYGIAVITTMDFDEIKKDIPLYVERLNKMSSNAYEGVLIFILDIFKNGSYVLYNAKSENLIATAFKINNLYEGYFIKDLISRKKQILPALLKELE